MINFLVILFLFLNVFLYEPTATAFIVIFWSYITLYATIGVSKFYYSGYKLCRGCDPWVYICFVICVLCYVGSAVAYAVTISEEYKKKG